MKPYSISAFKVGSSARINTKNARKNPFKRLNILTYAGIMIIAAAVLAVPVYSVRSSSQPSSSQANVASGPLAEASDLSLLADSNSLAQWSSPTFRSVLPTPTQSPETIETFAANCTTPRTTFILGEQVCAKVTFVTESDRFVNWLSPPDSVAFSSPTIVGNQAQDFLYTPTVTGLWKATIADPSDSSIIPVEFMVVDQTAPLTTYTSGCTSAQSTFSLGNTVCARVVGVGPGLNRRLFWIDPAGNLRAQNAVTADPQSIQFMLPTSETDLIGDELVDNTGPWKVNIVSNRGSAVYSVIFNVTGATPTADLGVAKAVVGDSPNSGAEFSYVVAVTNYGPSVAQNVVLSDPQPINATFVSILQTSGPTTPSFNCDGSNPVVCTRLTLAVGDTATFELKYMAGSSGSITNVATIDSDTVDPNPDNDSHSYGPTTINDGGGGDDSSCTLDCPADMFVTATSPSGAVVTFSEGFEVAGNCGEITFNPVSGFLFPVGTTTVTAQSSVGGGSCTFHITVVDSAAPTITCPLPTLTGNAPNGQTETAVTVNTPSATGTCVSVTGSRDDDRAVSDPYPVGTTLITWTATEILGNCPPTLPAGTPGRTASCSQIVTVSSGDLPTISGPPDRTFTTANCAYTATAAEIGTPTTTGNLATPEPGETNPAALRSDLLPLSAPFPAGVTVITWTATDTVGRVVSRNQIITVNSTGDSTPPTLHIPADINVTTTSCSEVLDDELGVATAEDACSAVSISRVGIPLFSCPIPGNPTRMCESFVFPVGTTNIVYTATDGSGHSTSATQHVTVHEATPPIFTSVPGNVGPVNNDPGSCGAFVSNATLGTASVADNCDTTVIRTGVPAGNIFPVGNTTVTYTAKADITVFRTQIVTVVDNTPPVVTPPAAVTLFTGPGATSCGVTVTNLNGTFGTGSATDNCPGLGSVTRGGVPAGNVFPVGPTTLTYSVTDAHGNTSSANQLVTVVDNTPPAISCQADIIADFNPAVNGAVVTYTTPVGTDNCPSSTIQIAGLPSGSTFPVGTTTNTFKVTDASNNTALCSFKVTVALTSLIGLDSVTMTGAGYADSYSSAGGYPATKGSLANILSNGTITMGNSAKVWGNVRSTRANVNMTGASQVTGNATAGTTVTTSGSASVGGTRTNNALAPVMTLPSVPACGPPYSSASGISGTYSYNATTGDLTLSGVNIATLANGNYCFHNVTLGNSSQLKVNGPVVIKLTGTLNTSGASNLNNTTQIPSNLRILSSYSGSNGVVIGNSVSVYALIYAPQTGLNMSGAAPLFGTADAKTITIGNSAAIHYDTQLKTAWPAIWTLILGP